MFSPLTAGVTLVVALLVLGPKNLPELAKAAGKALGEFKKAANGLEEDLKLEPTKLEATKLEPAQREAAEAPESSLRG